MRRHSNPMALYTVGTELRTGKNVNTTANRFTHHCTDMRNVICDLRSFFGVAIESVYSGYVNPISGRKTRYIETYKLSEEPDNLLKMDEVLDSLAREIDELRTAYSTRRANMAKKTPDNP